MITVIQTKVPENVCKTFRLMPDGKIEKSTNAWIRRGVATSFEIETLEQMAELLRKVSETHDCALVLGQWEGAKAGVKINVRTEKDALKELGEVPKGLIDIKGKMYGVRSKEQMRFDGWILIDADNPPGMPKEMSRMTMQERLEALEVVLPGISTAGRVEMPSSSSRVKEGGEARHAYIRVKGDIGLLKNVVLAGALENDLVFLSPKMSRADVSVVVGHSVLTLIDMSVWQPNRLIFAAAPIVLGGVEIYPAEVRVVQGDVLDLTWMEKVQPERMTKAGKKAGIKLDLDHEGNLHDEDSLTLDMELEDAEGEIRSVGDWLRGSKDGFHLRCQTPFRVSNSVAAFLTRKGSKVLLHDSGTSTSYHMQLPMTMDEAVAEAEKLGEGDADDAKSIMAACGHLSDMEMSVVSKAVKKSTGIGLALLMAAGKRARALLRPKEDIGEDSDDLKIAKMILADNPDIIRNAKQFWVWDGSGVWVAVDDEYVARIILERLEGSGASAGRMQAVMTVIKALVTKDVDWNQIEGDAVEVLSGRLVLGAYGWELMGHDKGNMCTTVVPVVYDAKAVAPRFLRALGEILQDIELRQLYLEMLGYTLMSHAQHERAVIMHGEGNNGKSVLINVVRALVGTKNVCAVSPKMMGEKMDAVAQMFGKLANILGDIDDKDFIADGPFKASVSGETMMGAHKFKDAFEFRPFVTHWVATNKMPHSRDTSNGVPRRVCIIPLNRVFSGDEVDVRMKDVGFWKDELPGILNLALSAYAAAVERGFTVPAASEAAKKEWQEETNPVRDFVVNYVEKKEGGFYSSDMMYADFVRWCKEAGVAHMPARKGFVSRVRQLGVAKYGQNGGTGPRGFFGLKGDFEVLDNVVPFKPDEKS